MKRGLLTCVALLVIGCASGNRASVAPPRPTPIIPVAAATVQEPEASAVPQAKGPVGEALEMSYALPDAEDWTEGDRRAVGFDGWTPDAVIRNEKLGAVLVFAGFPSNLGSTLDVADTLRAKFAQSTSVTAESTGRFASFAFCKKRAKAESERTCGKVYVVRPAGDLRQYVLIVGTWPESSGDEATKAIDVAARSFAATQAQ